MSIILYLCALIVLSADSIPFIKKMHAWKVFYIDFSKRYPIKYFQDGLYF